MKQVLFVFALFGAAAATARADVIFALDNADQFGNPGDTLIFTGILSNTGLSTVFLNSADLNLAGSSFTPDFIDPFFNNVPISLDAGQSSADIELFDVMLNDPFTDPLGKYTGTYTLTGGVDSNAQDVLGSVDFSVTATNGTSPVPEPSSFGLLAAALAGIVIQHRRSRFIVARLQFAITNQESAICG